MAVRLAVQAPGDLPPRSTGARCLNVFIHLLPFPVGVLLSVKDRFGMLVLGPAGVLESFVPPCLVRPL